MSSYLVLANLTDQGIRTVKDTVKRADAMTELAGKFGVKVKEIYYTVGIGGAYDIVCLFDAPDDASFSAFGLAIQSGGNLRAQSLRAFSKAEMSQIVAKLG